VIFRFLEESKSHWAESFWWMMARNFGTKTNAEAFEALARTLPLSLIAKHKNSIHQLEALLLGQAGLLNLNFEDDYARLLQREYLFLKKKYGLHPVNHPVHFLRMRPGNFPTIRLAQLAALIYNSGDLFPVILQTESSKEMRKLFDVCANDYWHYHYRFDEASAFHQKKLGKDMADNIIINTVVPVLFAYGLYHKEEKFKTRALSWLEETAPEVNTVTKEFIRLGVSNKSAFDSQALIELKTKYCDDKHCLSCSIGNALLKLNQSTDRVFL
jgi:hypothetical protein